MFLSVVGKTQLQQFLKVRHYKDQALRVKLPGSSPVQGVLQAGGEKSNNGLRNKEAGSILVRLAMGRIEFPSTPINAPVTNETTPVEQNGYQQPTLAGMELEQSPEIELGNCIVTTAVKFRKLVRGMFEAHAYQSKVLQFCKYTRLKPLFGHFGVVDKSFVSGLFRVHSCCHLQASSLYLCGF